MNVRSMPLPARRDVARASGLPWYDTLLGLTVPVSFLAALYAAFVYAPTEAVQGDARRVGRRCPMERRPRRRSGAGLLSRGSHQLPGGRGFRLPDDGASLYQALIRHSFVPGDAPTHTQMLRSPRPGVSPPCPEHGGLASLLDRSHVA